MKHDTRHRHILLCVTGLTPQIVTETLYALYKNGRTLPEQIHVLTTDEGANRARLTLISDNWLSRFYRDYALTPITFDAEPCLYGGPPYRVLPDAFLVTDIY